jgi:signal transduction histidine kinase
MKKILQRLILKLRKHLPLSRELRYEYKRVLLTIQITLVGIIASSLFTVIDFMHEHYYSMIQDISTTLVFIFCLYLISKGKISYGKLLIILYTCVSLTMNGSRDGRYAGNEYLWFPILGGVFLFFSSKEKPFMIISFIVSLSSIIFLEYTEYSFFLYANTIPQLLYMNYLLSFSISIIMTCFYLQYLIKLNTDSEKKLGRLNHILLIRNENLKKINNELDSFVYKASHDMRAPLTSLLGLIEVSKKENNIEVIREFSALQEKSIKKLDSYILDILNISRNARMEVEMREIDFKEMLESTFEQLHYLEQGTPLKVNISIQQPGKFYGDTTRINIIFSNLISNCIRYMDTSKEECVIDITINSNEELADITITDNGSGIPAEHLTKVFNMFYRASENNSGSGLGLYIVKETLLKLKGSIQIDSEVRKFTTVMVQIPNINSSLPFSGPLPPQ